MSPVDYHAWTHRPKALGGTDPIEFEPTEMDVAYIFNSSGPTINDSDTTVITGYDDPGTSTGSSMVLDEANGQIEIMDTGVYLVQFITQWLNAFAFPKLARISWSTTGELHDTLYVQTWISEEDLGVNSDHVSVQALLVVTNDDDPTVVQGSVRQESGISQDIVGAELTIVRMSGVTI